MHQNTKLLFQKFAKRYFEPGARVLEIGPNLIPSDFQILFPKEEFVWDTLDLDRGFDRPLTYVTKDEYRFPIADSTYDVILAANVIEHVRKTWVWMRELARIAKPGGRVITINPISWEYHEDPVDCWRIYPEGMKALCDEAGLEVEICEWDALGIASLRKIGGRTQLWQKLSGVINLAHWKLRTPWEACFDLVTVAQKPHSRSQ